MVFFIFLFVLISIGLGLSLNSIWKALRASKNTQAKLAEELEEIRTRYKDITDLEEFKRNLSSQLMALRNQITEAQSLNNVLLCKQRDGRNNSICIIAIK